MHAAGPREADDVALDIEDRIDPAHYVSCQRRLGDIGEYEKLAQPRSASV
jgi:hypothetical protein